MRRSLAACAALTVSVLATAASPAAAGEILSTDVSVADAVKLSCIEGPLAGGKGYATRSVTTPDAGWISARLEAGSGDWDVAIFDDTSGRRVAGSTFFGASEVAQGFVTGGERLTVQACRRSGEAGSARLSVESTAVEAPKDLPTISLVRVLTPNRARKDELTSLGLDLTEHGRAGFVEVVLRGAADARKLREAKFLYMTEVADLAAQSRRDRAAERTTPGLSARALPSGRTGTYRRLADFTQEMKDLAAQNPTLVKPITLPFKTSTGMSVEGIEITENVNARDGKPVYLQMGGHHAREWPSTEHTIEWAHELVNGYRAGDARVRRLMSDVRTIVVPVINPEGFNVSREAGQINGAGGGRPGDANADLAFFASTLYEYQRKNCRVINTEGEDPDEGDCMGVEAAAQGCANTGLSQFGVDPNRNYGGFWGGPGATPGGSGPFGDCAQDYRGNGPFSEPETQNVRALVASHHVTTLITNHTYSNLILRPPAIRAQGPTVDEPIYKALGDSMAANNAYTSEPSFNLYDTSGGTEDWTYYTTGGLGYTFEIGDLGFHPPYAETIAEYEGGASAAGAGRGGNREAYFKAMENAADRSKHSVVTGGAPAGAVLRLKKNFKTSTSPVIDEDGETGEPMLFDDSLDTTMQVPESGRFEWHINPSTRPIIAQGQGRPPTGGGPSPPITRSGTASQPACPTYFQVSPESCVAGGFTDEVFEIPANSPSVDNGFANVKLEFEGGPEGVADLDLEVYKADAQGNATGEPIATSASSANPEQAIVGPDPEPGKYVARVINFAGGTTYTLSITFSGPKPYIAPATETWTLTCEVGGQVRATQELLIDRAERKAVDFGSACPGPAASSSNDAGSRAGRRCIPTRGGVRGRAIGPVRLGRTRAVQRRVLRPAERFPRSRQGMDRYCVRGGRQMRIGYPNRVLNARIGAKQRTRVRRRAVVAVTGSQRFHIRRVRVGMSVRTLRRRLRGEQRLRVDGAVWYLVRGRNVTLVFKTRRGKIRELGLADRRLTSTRRATKQLLGSYRGGRRG